MLRAQVAQNYGYNESRGFGTVGRPGWLRSYARNRSLKNVTSIGALANAHNRIVSAIIPLVGKESYMTPPAQCVQRGEDFGSVFITQFLEQRVSESPQIDLTVLRDVYVLPNGAIVSVDGQVLSDSLEPYHGDRLIAEAFAPWLEQVDDRLEMRLQSVRTVAEPLFHFREHGDQGFFHWMHSVLPKWDIGRYVRLHPDIKLLTPDAQPFNRSGLQLIGVDASRALVAGPSETIFARELWFVTPLVRNGDFWTRPLFVPRFYRSAYPASGMKRRLYVSRRDASFRALRNEDLLLRELIPLGFEPISLAGMSLPQQIELFRSAEAVIGVHGAGLSNIASLEPGSKVLEILSPQRYWPTYRAIASRAGLQYGVVVGSASEGADANSPISVEVDLVVRLLGDMDVTPSFSLSPGSPVSL